MTRFPWAIWKLVGGEWCRMSFVPGIEEAERLVREEAYGRGCVIVDASWTKEQVAAAASDKKRAVH